MDNVRTPPPSLPSSPRVQPTLRRAHSFKLTPGIPRRILLPIVKPPPPSPSLGSVHRSPRLRQASVKLTRTSRSGSIDLPTPPGPYQLSWAKTLGRLEVVQESVELNGYQIYAVEKWVVERSKLVTTVVVYTGNEQQQVFVAALAPPSGLSEADAKSEFDNAIFELRRDGARPKETSKGIVMITSLPNFRSDLNIVPILGGNYAAIHERLYVNINLLRMGCSGRSALTLDEPYPSSKDKFIQLYSISESVLSQISIQVAVIELVKLVQTALSLFEMFPLAEEERNGLLCDLTVAGIQRWTLEIGPYLELEPMERLLDPSAVAALLSLVISTRNKLSLLGISQVPKDPFAEPMLFLQGVMVFQRMTKHSLSNSFLDLDILQRIQTSYSKARQTEPYKVHRVLKHKLDDLTTASTSLATNLNLRSAPEPNPSLPLPSGSSANAGEFETSDLEAFVKFVLASAHPGGKDNTADSLKYLWTGKKAGPHHHYNVGKRVGDTASALLSAPLLARALSESGTSVHTTAPAATDKEDERPAEMEHSESFQGMLSRRKDRVKGKGQALVDGITGWTGGRLEFGRSRKTLDPGHENEGVGSVGSASRPDLPALVITNDPTDDDPLIHSPLDLTSPFKHHPYSATSSSTNLSNEYERKVTKFNSIVPSLPSRRKKWKIGFLDDMVIDEEDEGRAEKCLQMLRRSRSCTCIEDLMDARPVPMDILKTDVALCGQYMELLEREEEMVNASTIMKALLRSLTSLNKRLQHTLSSQRNSLSLIESQTYSLTQQTREGRRTSEELNRRVRGLGYQAEGMEEEVERMEGRLREYENRTRAAVRAVASVYVIEDGGEDDVEGEETEVEDAGEEGKEGSLTGNHPKIQIQAHALRHRLLPWLERSRARSSSVTSS